jgi:hypothetical protein
MAAFPFTFQTKSLAHPSKQFLHSLLKTLLYQKMF